MAKLKKKKGIPLVKLGLMLGILGLLGGLAIIKYSSFENFQAYQQPKSVAATESAAQKAESSASAKPLLPSIPPAPIVSGKQIRIPILTYHYIGYNPDVKDTAREGLSVKPEELDEQLGFLQKNGYTPISLDTAYAALKGNTSLPPKPIILTFDDGYIDFYVNAYPIIKKYNFHATEFIPTGLVGGSYYLKWDQIKVMDASGLISFEAHSVTHANLPSLSLEKLRWELTESKKMLENTLGKPVNFMAYPYGANNNLVADEAKKAGYLGATTTISGSVISEGTVFFIPRIKVSGSWTIEQFAKNL